MSPDLHQPNPYDLPVRSNQQLADGFCDWLREYDREIRQRLYREYLAAVRDCESLMLQFRMRNP